MNKKAYYGEFGGQYVAESLMNTLNEVDEAFEAAIKDPEFIKQFHYYLKQYVGRQTPLYFAERLSEKYGGGKTFDWTADAVNKRMDIKIPIVLAGGLNSKNVIDGIEKFQPDIVDVSTGVEGTSGKDKKLILDFIERVKHE